jgi:hypothetical protein
MIKTSHNCNGNFNASLNLISSPALTGSVGIILVRLLSKNSKMRAHSSENKQVNDATNKLKYKPCYAIKFVNETFRP